MRQTDTGRQLATRLRIALRGKNYHFTLTAFLRYRVNCEQVQFCDNVHCCTYFLVTRNMSPGYIIGFGYFLKLHIHFCRMISTERSLLGGAAV